MSTLKSKKISEKLNLLKIIHIVICAGIILVYIFIGDLHTLALLKIPKVDSESLIFLLIPLLSIFLSNFLYKEHLKKVDKRLSLEEKIPQYQTASIIRWAIIEGGIFIILFLKKEFILLGIFLIIYLIFLKPSVERMRKDFDIAN